MRTRLVVIGGLALTACAAPSGWDGLTGGDKPPALQSNIEETTFDPSLVAPRPVAPIGVSSVATTRPHFRWALGPGELGVRLELCPTRACDREVKAFDAEGSDLVLPEDLVPGVWFWRLVGRAAGRIGTSLSPTWELVVRGPAKHGTSDAPTDGILDLDGDGRPDLLVLESDVLDGAPATGIVFYPGLPDGTVGSSPTAVPYYAYAATLEASIAGGTDLDGDGFADVVLGGQALETGADGTPKPTEDAIVELLFGSDKLYDPNVTSDPGRWSFLRAPIRGAYANVVNAGDTNGDGYGDLAATWRDGSLLAYGANGGPRATVFVTSESTPSARPAVIAGAFDANGDGAADFALASPDPQYSAVAVSGASVEAFPRPLLVPGGKAPGRATAIAAGDFDGDGLSDVAFTTTIAGRAHICISRGDRTRLVAEAPCLAAEAYETTFGETLRAADLDGDGIDELLATKRTVDGRRIDAITLAGDVLRATPIGMPGFGDALTVTWPGRPGKARWAATNGTWIALFEGTELLQTMQPASVTKIGTIR